MVNKVTLIGRLGKDPEVRRFDGNSAKAEFPLATSESYTNREGQRVENTEWHNIAIWRPGLVDVAEKYLRKGSLVYIEGKLRTRNWEDQNGVRKYMTEIIVDNFRMLDSRSDRQESNSGGGYQGQSGQQNAPAKEEKSSVNEGNQDELDDDLPF